MDVRLIGNLVCELEGEGVFRNPGALFRLQENFHTDRWKVHACSEEVGAIVDAIIKELGEQLTVGDLLREVNGDGYVSREQARRQMEDAYQTIIRLLALAARFAGEGSSKPGTGPSAPSANP